MDLKYDSPVSNEGVESSHGSLDAHVPGAAAPPLGLSGDPISHGDLNPSKGFSDESSKSRGNATTVMGNPHARRKRQRCRFFGTKNGCRAGERCPFLHETDNPKQSTTETRADIKATTPSISASKSDKEAEAIPQSHVKTDESSHVSQGTSSQKPSKDPRAFQISQIKIRFSAKEDKSQDGVTTLHFKMPPSDPDFPFEIENLDCILRLPIGFPQYHKPTLRVKNQEMERGYQINVENGFDAIWSQASQPTLLNAMKLLDKRLETLLTAQKADILKIIANNAHPPILLKAESAVRDNKDIPKPSEDRENNVRSEPSQPTAEKVKVAESKRLSETQTMEHRFGRLPGFLKLEDGTIYHVPLEPRKRPELPPQLQAIKAIRLFVPRSYGIDPCTIEIMDVEDSSIINVENAFKKRVTERPELTIMAHINYLAQNMHNMAKIVGNEEIERVASIQKESISQPKKKTPILVDKEEDSHIHYIPRPPEWDKGHESEEGGDSGDSEIDSDSSISDGHNGCHSTAEEDQDSFKRTHTSTREVGTMISFPDLQIFGIELLELVNLNLTIKCDRCKESQDVHNLRPAPKPSTATSNDKSTIETSCKKCANPLNVSFRPDLIHAASNRAGYLDLDGCTPIDLLASSSLTPTCASCSTSMLSGMAAHRGNDHSMAICRHCHQRMSFSMPSVKFLHIGPSTRLPNLPLRRKQPKENLGIVAGTPLPSNGRCPHYRRSNRWFRFSCCQKVFPCDKCHDAAAETQGHVMEFANRMICGFCSREQNYRPENCGFCGQGLVGKRGTGFWEGGKGTRDPKKMSRKDPRKYKRRPKKV